MKGGVAGSGGVEHEEGSVSLESSDEHERVELVLLEGGGDSSEVDVGKGSVSSELRPSSSSPSIDSEPVELGDVVFEETVESVVDRDGGVAPRETVSDHLSGRGVHSSGGGPDAEEGEGKNQGQAS